MKNNKIDNKKLEKEAKQKFKYLIIKFIKERIPYHKISEITKSSLSAISKYWKIYKEFEEKDLILKKKNTYNLD